MTDPTPFPKKKRKKGAATKQMELADTLFGTIIRSPGRCVGRCEGNPKGHLQCAHGFSRRYRATRWDERNAWPLCSGCHVYWTHRPIEWDEWMRARLGEVLYEELRQLALFAPNPDMTETIARLRSRWAEIEREAA